MFGLKFHKKSGLGQDLIIFIHGINSDNDAWKNEENNAFWPDFFSEYEYIDVALFSYKTSKLSGHYSITNAADSLHNELKVNGCNEKYDRIIFLCHSMGGVVVRKTLVKFQRYFDDCDLVLYLVASPSMGSFYANLLRPLAVIMRQKQLPHLTKSNEWLGQLNREFRRFLSYRKENDKPIKGKELIEDMSPIGGLPWFPQVVSDFAGAYFFEDDLKISSTDHSTIVKLQDQTVTQHTTLLKLIEAEKFSTSSKKKTFKKLESVNSPIAATPYYFQNREDEIQQLSTFLKQDSLGVLLVLGEGGLGKTALIYKYLDTLESENDFESIIHIDCRGRKSNIASDIRSDLLKTMNGEFQEKFHSIKHQLSIPSQTDIILKNCEIGKRIIIIDNFEDSLNEKNKLVDAELVDLFNRIKLLPSLPIKVFITARLLPEIFKNFPPNLFELLPLKKGLSKEHTVKMIAVMTKNELDDDLGSLLFEKTKGIPRSIEAVFQNYRFSEDKTLLETLNNMPDEGAYQLVKYTLSSLSVEDIKILEFVSAFPESMPASAFDFFNETLQLNIQNLSVRRKKLEDLRVLKRIKDRYHLHPIDRSVVIGQIKDHEREALIDCAEQYFTLHISEVDTWTNLDDASESVSFFNFLIEHNRVTDASVFLEELSSFLKRIGAFNTALVCAQQLYAVSKQSSSRQTALSIICGMHWRMGKTEEALAANDQLRDLSQSKFRCDVNELIFGGDIKWAEEKRIRTWDELYERMPKELEFEIGNQSIFLDSYADVYQDCGKLDKALALKMRALKLAKEQGDIDWIEAMTHNVGIVYEHMGLFREANTQYLNALGMTGKSNNRLWKANHIAKLGDIKLILGELEEASKLYDDALDIYTKIQAQSNVHSTKWNKAKLLVFQGRYREAYVQADSVYKEIKLYCELDTYDKINAYLYTSFFNERDETLDLLDTIENCSVIDLAKKHLMLGTRFLKLGDGNSAILNFNKAVSICDALLKNQCNNFEAAETKLLSLMGLKKFEQPTDLEFTVDTTDQFGEKGNRLYWNNFCEEMLLYDARSLF